MGADLRSQVNGDGPRGKGLQLHQGRFRMAMRKKVFSNRGAQALEQAAQGCGGLTVPGGRCARSV